MRSSRTCSRRSTGWCSRVTQRPRSSKPSRKRATDAVDLRARRWRRPRARRERSPRCRALDSLRRRGSGGERRHDGTTGGCMSKHGKRYRSAYELTSKAGAVKDLADAVRLVKQTARAKFDETIVISSHLGVDPRHSDQLVRGTVVLPHGTGKSLRVLVLAKGDKVKEALAAGADHAGSEEFVKKIQEGWLDVDAIVATPDMMGEVGKLGRVLGPRGLMPNPKSGTVTFDVAKAVRDLKAGKI